MTTAASFPSSVPTFAHYLRQMGYRTCLSGKMHFVGPDQLHGFDERITTDIYPSDFAWTPDWELPDEQIDQVSQHGLKSREAGVANTTFRSNMMRKWPFSPAASCLNMLVKASARSLHGGKLYPPHDRARRNGGISMHLKISICRNMISPGISRMAFPSA